MDIVTGPFWFYLILTLSIFYGLLFVFPIGGADMPVVISLLNSFRGGCRMWWVSVRQLCDVDWRLSFHKLDTSTVAMCKAMNRSLLNVLVGNFGGGGASVSSDGGAQGSTKEILPVDTAILMKYASKVVTVPGYGLAVAQAQHICHELENLLEEGGVIVKYAIRPLPEGCRTYECFVGGE